MFYNRHDRFRTSVDKVLERQSEVLDADKLLVNELAENPAIEAENAENGRLSAKEETRDNLATRLMPKLGCVL
jgi:hypothetical protein